MIKKKYLNKSSGFSIVEILVALTLLALAFTVLVGGNITGQQKLDSTILDIERALKFALDEAGLRNSVVRIHFNLDNSPQTFAVEYTPSGDFMIPNPDKEDKLSLERDDEKEKRKNKKLNSSFKKIKNFQTEDLKISEDVKILGIGSSISEIFTTEGEASIYIFPTGEKDGAFIVMASKTEMATIAIKEFSPTIEKNIKSVENFDEDGLLEKQYQEASNMFSEWLKK